MKYPYKSFPLNTPDPVTKLSLVWRPVVKVLIWHRHKRSAPFEAVLDTGADHCVFNAVIGEYIGIPVTQGIRVPLSGFVRGENVAGFLHYLNITVAAQTYEAPVVFAYGVTALAVLGQVGFFDHFVATFDWTTGPPSFDLQRIQRN